MNVQELMGRVIDELYAGLTGGSAELPLPKGTKVNWVLPGIPLHESFFNFAIAGPYAGPSPATLDDFKALVEALAGGQDGGAARPIAEVIDDAKRMYQQHLLGSWEQWSRLVDFIPLMNPDEQEMSWSSQSNQGSQGHRGIVYGQAGQTLSQVYQDTLERSLVADEPLTPEQEKILERMRALLQTSVEKTDFLTGEKRTEIVDSPALTLYNGKKLAYENAVIDYASRLARANSGTSADLIEWQRSGGIFRQRALQALRDWQANGNKEAIETAQSTIAHITGGSMVQWKQNLLDAVTEVEENTQGAFGYSFFPATVLPGAFARSDGWTKYNQRNTTQHITTSSSSQAGGGGVALHLGIFSVGGAGGASRREEEFQFQRQDFGIEFEYTQAEISRPGFSPNYYLSRGWKPRDSFIADYGPAVNATPDKNPEGAFLHSTGSENPEGVFVGYPTKALFVRNLRIYSSELAQFIRSKESEIQGGATFAIGPFGFGGRYAQTNRESESNYESDEAGITINGMQLVAFVSALFPATSNPNPDVENWI